MIGHISDIIEGCCRKCLKLNSNSIDASIKAVLVKAYILNKIKEDFAIRFAIGFDEFGVRLLYVLELFRGCLLRRIS